jgi:hypothetical protein
MKYIVERDLFMSKMKGFINDKFAKGYRLHSMIVTEMEEKTVPQKANSKITVANKVTLVFEEIDK